jgi:hypothetical protein
MGESVNLDSIPLAQPSSSLWRIKPGAMGKINQDCTFTLHLEIYRFGRNLVFRSGNNLYALIQSPPELPAQTGEQAQKPG